MWGLALLQVFSCLVAGQFVFTVIHRSKRVANNKQQTKKNNKQQTDKKKQQTNNKQQTD